MTNHTAKNPMYSRCHITNHVVYPERCLVNCLTNILKINMSVYCSWIMVISISLSAFWTHLCISLYLST